MEHDYSNPHHVDYLFRNLYKRNVMDWKGIGLILWDVHNILLTQIELTSGERQLVRQIAAGYEVDDLPFEYKARYYGLIDKFTRHHSELEKLGTPIKEE